MRTVPLTDGALYTVKFKICSFKLAIFKMSRSAEPTRRAPYSNDLRWRIVWQRIALGHGFEKIASNLNISVGTAHNIFKLFEATGEVDHKPQPKRERKLDSHHEIYIIGMILDSPTLQLSEIASKVEEMSGTVVSTSTLCRLLASYGMTRKKVQHVALQRCLDLRASFVASVFTFSKEMFVWVDETGSNMKDMLRKYGYALRGERAVCPRLLVRGQRISAISAMSTEGIVVIELTNDSVNGEKFFDFVHGSLIPEMLPFDGYSPKSIAVMDNCSIHHVQEVADLFNSAGILLIYLPPYSPDFNPIELAFSYVKHYLKDHEDIMHIVPPTQLVHAAFSSITARMCNSWIVHCGY